MLYTIEGDVPEEAYTIPFGEANIVREGGDVTIVALGRDGRIAPRRPPRSSRPTASSARSSTRARPRRSTRRRSSRASQKTGRLVVVDEANPRCGMAADIVARVAQECFDALEAAPQMVTPPHTPVPFSPVLEDPYVPDAETDRGGGPRHDRRAAPA